MLLFTAISQHWMTTSTKLTEAEVWGHVSNIGIYIGKKMAELNRPPRLGRVRPKKVNSNTSNRTNETASTGKVPAEKDIDDDDLSHDLVKIILIFLY